MNEIHDVVAEAVRENLLEEDIDLDIETIKAVVRVYEDYMAGWGDPTPAKGAD